MITITSKKKGFRRCGMAHDDRPIEHADDVFTAEQLEILRAEPMLTVAVTEEDAKKGKGKKAEA